MIDPDKVEALEKAESLKGIWAVVRYDLLWNLRKKKFVGMVIIALLYAVLSITLGPIILLYLHQKVVSNPTYVESSSDISGFVLFLFALVTTMNSISSEFEGGTIIPLLTKPVSRMTVFFGKALAAFISLTAVYVLIYIIETVGGIAIYGPQSYLYDVPLLLVGNILSTLVWMSIILALGAVTKSTLFSALVPFLLYFGILFAAGILSASLGEVAILNYLPGTGNLGSVVSSRSSQIGLFSISTGTDGIASTLVAFAMHPSYYVIFTAVVELGSRTVMIEPLSYVLLTAIGVVFAYIFVFLFIGWFAFRQAQVSE